MYVAYVGATTNSQGILVKEELKISKFEIDFHWLIIGTVLREYLAVGKFGEFGKSSKFIVYYRYD